MEVAKGNEVGAAGPVKWWAVKSKMNGWNPPGIKWSLPEGKLLWILRQSCLPQWATASLPRGSSCLISLCLRHSPLSFPPQLSPLHVFLIPAAGSLNRSQAKTCKGLSLASCFGRTELNYVSQFQGFRQTAPLVDHISSLSPSLQH